MIPVAAATFLGAFIVMPIVLWFLRMFGFYAIIEERRCHVYTLFGNVAAVLDEPGLTFLWLKMGPKAFVIRWLGKCYVIDMRMDQAYLRSQAVNSEEGAPMGVGVWYEMYVSDPVSYLFKNADPRGSLRTNVANATVRALSNMKLSVLLENRHGMSQMVRGEVSPLSKEWGYQLGSVYIRKVHLRDVGMIRQIEEKVVNRLRQVTSAIRQDGANQVNVITGTVLEYGEVRSGSTSSNVISVSLKMLEAQSGKVVWTASSTQGGVTASARLFGGGGQPMDEVTEKAVEDLLDKLFKKK